MFKRIPGTKDILPAEVVGWQKLEHLSREVFLAYNYTEIRPPVIEDAVLFDRSLGEFAEVVQKQMFLIKNQDDLYALRPEGTASIVRAYIENSLDKTSGFVKLYYIGPMFRLERPQKGRLRQFHHIGAEAIGSAGPEIDVEVISLADRLLRVWKIEGYKIKLNSLGCSKDKSELTAILRKGLENKIKNLCPECQVRFEHNVLRILDCKNTECQEVVKNLDIQDKYLCQDCKSHFEKVKIGLNALKINYEVSPYLVRGLDYYTRTVFEIKHESLGAQDAIGAGGRYDNLVKELGGPDVGSIGFAFGVERLLLVKSEEPAQKSGKLVFLINLGDAAKAYSYGLLNSLRDAGIAADTDYEGKSLKGAMRSADAAGARFVLVIGDNELKKNAVMVKDMQTGNQEEIGLEAIIDNLKGRI